LLDLEPALGHIEQGFLVGALKAARVLDKLGHLAGVGYD
jgi:hypothetical protein